MATKSICKTVHIRDKRLASQLINALESAKGKRSTEIHFSKKVYDLKGDQIKDMFGAK